MDFRFVVREGAYAGRVFRIAVGDQKMVGRAPWCDIRLPDQGVSRSHCTVENKGAVLRVIDLDSANGTYINEQQVNEGSLKPGDELWLGPVILECRAEPTPERVCVEPTAEGVRKSKRADILMHKTELIEQLAGTADLSKADARRVVKMIFDPSEGLIVRALCAGEEVRIGRFGVFVIQMRAERTGRHPRTGELVSVAARPVVRFRPGSALRRSVRAGTGLVLVVREGEHVGRVFIIAQGDQKLIGRAHECDVRLPDPSVSRRHCTVENLGAVLRALDLESTNGTYINEQLVKEGPLKPADQLSVGGVVLECMVPTAKWVEPREHAEEAFAEVSVYQTVPLLPDCPLCGQKGQVYRLSYGYVLPEEQERLKRAERLYVREQRWAILPIHHPFWCDRCQEEFSVRGRL
jgi:DNA-binding protein HU-beta